MVVRLTASAITVLLLAGVAPAAATKVTYVCGNDLCRIDPAQPRTVQRLTHDDGHYVSPSVSWDGRRMAFFRGVQLYRADGSGRRRRKLASEVVGRDPGQAFMSPAGTAIATIETRDVLYPTGSRLQKLLLLYPAGRRRSYEALPYTTVLTASWLGSRLVFGIKPAGGNQMICVPEASEDGCAPVAADPGYEIWWPSASRDARLVVATKVVPSEAARGSFDGRISLFDARTGKLIRDLTHGQYDVDPVFSPDGSQVAFNRGRDLFVIRTNGADLGDPRLLRHNARHPSWSR